MSRQRAAALLCAALGLLVCPATAADRPALRAPPAAEQLADAFVDELTAKVERQAGSTAALVFAAGTESGTAAAGGELGRLVARLLEGRLRSRAGFVHVVRLAETDHAAAVDTAAREGATLLLEVQLHLVGGELLLSGTATPTWVNFWTGEITGEPRAVAARVRADRAAVLLARASTAAVPTAGRLQLRSLAQLSGEVVAVAVGDVDGDGRMEIAALSAVALTLHRLEGGRLETLATRRLHTRPRAPTPARDPAGGVVISRIALRPAVAYHHSDLASGEVLRFERGSLEAVADIPEVPVAATESTVAYAGLLPGQSVFAGTLRLAGEGARRLDAGAPVLDVAFLPDGETLMVVAADHRLRNPETAAPAGTRKRRPARTRPEPVGSGLAFADLDGDGVVERIGSTPVAPGRADRLVIADLEGAVRELRPVPGAVRALSAGDATGDGRDDVLIASVSGGDTVLYLLSEEPP